MSGRSIAEHVVFDLPRLYAALDTERREWELSWHQVACEIGVARSTIVRTAYAASMEADGVLAMVRWLSGRRPSCDPHKLDQVRACRRDDATHRRCIASWISADVSDEFVLVVAATCKLQDRNLPE